VATARSVMNSVLTVQDAASYVCTLLAICWGHGRCLLEISHAFAYFQET
jgi:hypothetical protein